MAEKIKPLVGDRIKGESWKSITACNDYLRMGVGRSLRKLRAFYDKQLSEGKQIPPTKSLPTLGGWSLKFQWVERSKLYDLEMEKEKDQIVHADLKRGLSLSGYRVEELKELFEKLKEEFWFVDENGKQVNLWLPDVKKIGTGDDAKWKDIVRYNSAIINDMFRALDDLAKETGGRIRKQEMDIKGTKIVVSLKNQDND